MSSSPISPVARLQRKWTVAEDRKLREEVEAQMVDGDDVKDWCRIANELPGRTNKDCRKRWYNSVLGGLKKGQWSKSEDVQLARGVQQYGQRWTLVANVVASRSADQCAKRWQQSLDPDLDRSEWRDTEDKVLIDAVQRFGRHWKDIQRHHFPGRSKNCIKNRYTVLIRRYQNQGIVLPQRASTPESSMGSPSPNVKDDMPCSQLYDDITQASTPETLHSWPTEERIFPVWASNDVSNAAVSVSGFSQSHQWQWPPSPMPQPAIMHSASPNMYSQIPSPAAMSPYDAYGTVQTLSLHPTHYHGTSHTRAATSSPSPITTTASHYHPFNYINHAVQSDHQYRF